LALAWTAHISFDRVVGLPYHRGRAAQESIRSESGNHAIELMIADLSSQTAIRELVAQYKTTHTRLDILVNNAGVNVKRRTLTPDGIELNIAWREIVPRS